MQLNRNLMNLMAQLLDAIVQSGVRDIHDNPDPEVLRLSTLTVDAIIEAHYADEDLTQENRQHLAEVLIQGQIELYIKP